jgi:hypothetical protein
MIVVKISWGITAAATVLAGLAFIAMIGEAGGAPQEAAAAGIALAIVVIPYVFTRCLEGLFHKA